MIKRKRKISQQEFVKNWFIQNAGRDIPHSESKNALETLWKKKYGSRFEDSDRSIRTLCDNGFLIKIKNGVYRHDPSRTSKRKLRGFSAAQKKLILERDGYKCVECGLGPKNGVVLHVDHIKPQNRNGKSEILNGQTLCASHNFIKKIASQTQTGKRMFIRLLELSKKSDDSDNEQKEKLVAFCLEILSIYEKHKINGQILWTEDI